MATSTSKPTETEKQAAAAETNIGGSKAYRELAEAPDSQAITAGTWPNPIEDFRKPTPTGVGGFPLVGLIPVGDEKTPYPTGTPLGAGKKFWLIHGYAKGAGPA